MMPSFNVTTDTQAPLGAAMPDSGTPIEVPPLYARLPKPFATVKSFCEPGKHKLKHSILRIVAIGLSLLTFTSAQAAEGTVAFEVLKPEAALQAAQAALENCRASGYQVAVAVVDRFGGIQVVLRDQLASPRTVDTAIGKARTAAGFRTNTTDMVSVTAEGTPQAGIRNLPGVIVIGGGMFIEAAGSLVGGIGVSGAPGPHLDDICAQAGIDNIEDLLEF